MAYATCCVPPSPASRRILGEYDEGKQRCVSRTKVCGQRWGPWLSPASQWHLEAAIGQGSACSHQTRKWMCWRYAGTFTAEHLQPQFITRDASGEVSSSELHRPFGMIRSFLVSSSPKVVLSWRYVPFSKVRQVTRMQKYGITPPQLCYSACQVLV